MTAPANALNSGEGLRWLEPDESWTGSWASGASGPDRLDRGGLRRRFPVRETPPDVRDAPDV
ncbi:hypothetical protein P9139_00855 [Curtobacterium flaccumfaciens]|nr:hypothetical protein P9139_00855 [Curtobacterium flaccumfaciens]